MEDLTKFSESLLLIKRGFGPGCLHYQEYNDIYILNFQIFKHIYSPLSSRYFKLSIVLESHIEEALLSHEFLHFYKVSEYDYFISQSIIINQQNRLQIRMNHNTLTQNFDYLEGIISANPTNQNLMQQTLDGILQQGISFICKKQLQKFTQIAKEFSNLLQENRHIFLHPDFLIENFQELKFVVCKLNKVYQLGKPNSDIRGYAIVGKAVNVHKRKKKVEEQYENKQQKQQFSNLIEQGIIRIFQDNKYILPKHQKHFQIDDVLLHHDMPDTSIDEVYLSNEVFNLFVPVEKSIILITPGKSLKPQCMSVVKSSLLHVFMDQIQLLSKIMTKQLFYKNSILKGIFFIDEGEVEVKSGRVIARGWTTYGKCKTSGFGWKFKPIPFIRFLVKNSAIWKQFLNDLKLNEEYPFNVINILGLNDDEDFTSSVEWKSLGRRKIGSKSPKLPKLNVGSRSFDEAKYEQIQKLRHYDERINDIFTYKQDLLTRKLKGLVHGKYQPIFGYETSQKMERNKKLIMMRMNSKGTVFSKRQLPVEMMQPTENILIMSVLKRLESIADMSEVNQRTEYLASDLNPRNKRSNMKILPVQLNERIRPARKTKRY